MEEGGVTIMENLATAIQTAITTTSAVLTSVLELVVSNPLVMIFVASAIVGVAIGLFHKMKAVAA